MTTRPPGTLQSEYFDGLYERSPDPYGFTSRWYERRKYAVSAAMLPWPRYQNAFEPGCSVGVLTAQLAPRCDALLACDGVAAAVTAAAARTAGFPQVTVEQRRLPGEWPESAGPGGQYDLIVFSELLYYLSDGDLARTIGLAVDALEPGGTLLAVHWRWPVPFHPQTGDEAHAAIAARPELTLAADHREPDFLAQVFLRAGPGADPGAMWVAAAEGLT
ncbi:MAG TPA: methyltransferase [Streptosporangiaceae bacterium]